MFAIVSSPRLWELVKRVFPVAPQLRTSLAASARPRSRTGDKDGRFSVAFGQGRQIEHARLADPLVVAPWPFPHCRSLSLTPPSSSSSSSSPLVLLYRTRVTSPSPPPHSAFVRRLSHGLPLSTGSSASGRLRTSRTRRLFLGLTTTSQLPSTTNVKINLLLFPVYFVTPKKNHQLDVSENSVGPRLATLLAKAAAKHRMISQLCCHSLSSSPSSPSSPLAAAKPRGKIGSARSATFFFLSFFYSYYDVEVGDVVKSTSRLLILYGKYGKVCRRPLLYGGRRAALRCLNMYMLETDMGSACACTYAVHKDVANSQASTHEHGCLMSVLTSNEDDFFCRLASAMTRASRTCLQLIQAAPASHSYKLLQLLGILLVIPNTELLGGRTSSRRQRPPPFSCTGTHKCYLLRVLSLHSGRLP